MPAVCVGPVDRAKLIEVLRAEAREATLLHLKQTVQNELRLIENGVPTR
jgi:hypothetical protein